MKHTLFTIMLFVLSLGLMGCVGSQATTQDNEYPIVNIDNAQFGLAYIVSRTQVDDFTWDYEVGVIGYMETSHIISTHLFSVDEQVLIMEVDETPYLIDLS